jgi:hypothetical protein
MMKSSRIADPKSSKEPKPRLVQRTTSTPSHPRAEEEEPPLSTRREIAEVAFEMVEIAELARRSASEIGARLGARASVGGVASGVSVRVSTHASRVRMMGLVHEPRRPIQTCMPMMAKTAWQ